VSTWSFRVQCSVRIQTKTGQLREAADELVDGGVGEGRHEHATATLSVQRDQGLLREGVVGEGVGTALTVLVAVLLNRGLGAAFSGCGLLPIDIVVERLVYTDRHALERTEVLVDVSMIRMGRRTARSESCDPQPHEIRRGLSLWKRIFV
jgi:hypothetical protein